MKVHTPRPMNVKKRHISNDVRLQLIASSEALIEKWKKKLDRLKDHARYDIVFTSDGTTLAAVPVPECVLEDSEDEASYYDSDYYVSETDDCDDEDPIELFSCYSKQRFCDKCNNSDCTHSSFVTEFTSFHNYDVVE